MKKKMEELEKKPKLGQLCARFCPLDDDGRERYSKTGFMHCVVFAAMMMMMMSMNDVGAISPRMCTVYYEVCACMHTYVGALYPYVRTSFYTHEYFVLDIEHEDDDDDVINFGFVCSFFPVLSQFLGGLLHFLSLAGSRQQRKQTGNGLGKGSTMVIIEEARSRPTNCILLPTRPVSPILVASLWFALVACRIPGSTRPPCLNSLTVDTY